MAEVNQLSKQTLQEILETTKVDVGNGTLFGVSTRRAPSKERLTLVISSGGSGMSAIKEAMRIADQKLDEEYKTYVKFIVVDSDERELSSFEKMDGRVAKTLHLSLLGARDRFQQKHRNSLIKKIMPQDYNAAGLLYDSGASQDRMTGRIKLYDGYGGVGNDTRLKQIIKDLFAHDWLPFGHMPVDIILLTGISGGTGSGTFMDLAAIARSACTNVSNRNNMVRVYGYIMLPDTMEHIASDWRRGALYRNGFAALKELESYMSLCFEPERREIFPSTKSGEEIEVSALTPLFDYPVLVSGNYEEVISMIGETIVNLISASQGFDHMSLYSNLNWNRNSALSRYAVSDMGILKKGACPEDSRMYCGIGYAHASIPEKIVISNVIGKVCRKFYGSGDASGMAVEGVTEAFCSDEKPLTSVQFEHAIRMLFAFEGEVNSDSLWNKIYGILASAGRLPENEFAVSKSDIISGDVQLFLDGFRIDETVWNASNKIKGELKRLQEEFKRNAQRVMELYGPRAMQFLKEGKGYFTENGGREDLSRISIQTLLSTVQDKFQKLASKPGEYPPHVERKGVISVFTHGDVNFWMGQAAEAAQDDVLCKVAKILGGGTWKQEYENIVSGFLDSCVRFADVLDVMIAHYEGAGRVLDEGYEKFSVETGEKNGINLCQNQEMYNWVKVKVTEKIANVGLDAVKQDLIKDFMSNRADWVSEEEGKARKRFDEVMSRSCKIGKYAAVDNGLYLSVSDYFEEILNNVPADMQITRIQNEVASILVRLRQVSTPSLNIERDDNVVVKENILVPINLFYGPRGTVIKAAFDNVVGDPEKLHLSSVVDGIVCYQTSVANPISSLRGLTRWEIGYENSFGLETSATCHSCNGEYVTQYTELSGTETDAAYERQMIAEDIDADDNMLAGTGLSWRHYPSINLRIYGDNFQNKNIGSIGKTTESEYRASVFDRKIEYALREGIIECVKDGNAYTYFLNAIPEDWTNLSAANYVVDESQLEKGKYKRGQELFRYLAVQNLHSCSEWRWPIRLRGSEFFEHSFDFTEILEREHWEPGRVDATHKAYMKRIMRKNIFLYRTLEETLYRYDSIRRVLEESEIQYKEQEEL